MARLVHPRSSTAVALAAALLLSACTSGSAADDAATTPTAVEATTSTAAAGDDFGIETAAAATTPARVVTDLPESVPGAIAVTGGPGAVLIDRDTGDEIIIASPAPLEIGDDPANAERLTSMVDAGEHGFVVSRTLADRNEIALVGPGRQYRALGAGTSPVVDTAASSVAWIDGTTVVVTALPKGDTRRIEVAGQPASIAWRPDGAALAVGLVDGDAARVVLVDVATLATTPVAAPVGVDWTLPTWMDDDRLAVVEQSLVPGDSFSGVVPSGDVRVVVTDLTENRLEFTSAIDFGVLHADASPDGEAIALTGTDGIVRWWSYGTTGLLIAGVWETATW